MFDDVLMVVVGIFAVVYVMARIADAAERSQKRQIARAVEEVIENFEPRARLISVRAFPDLDRNEYELTIEFFVVNTPTELVDMTVFLEVLR